MSRRTPADDLREHATRLETQAAELRQIAETIEAATFVGSHASYRPHARASDLLDSAAAEKFTKLSRATLIRAARRDSSLGFQLPGRSWRFWKSRLIATFLRARVENGELVEFVEATPLPRGADRDHL